MIKEDNFNCYFHHVSLNVNNYHEVVAFYEALGMKKYVEWRMYGALHCFMDMGNGPFLELHGSNEELIDKRMQHICFHVDDVDSFYDLAIRTGAKPGTREPCDSPLECIDRTIIARVAHVVGIGGESIEIINWRGYDLSNYEAF